MNTPSTISAYHRSIGRPGIRNVLAVVYLVECAHHVARKIVESFPGNTDHDRNASHEHNPGSCSNVGHDVHNLQDVHLVGFPGCYPNAYAERILQRIGTHPNVGGVLIVSLGCESYDRDQLHRTIEQSGRPVKTVVIQESGGTSGAITAGRDWCAETLKQLAQTPRVEMRLDQLTIATICGGSDATSGLTANPAVGRCFDRLIQHRGTAIFEETGELIGCEHLMADRAETPELGRQIIATVEKAARYYDTLGHGSFAPGNADGGLTTIEEKSLGAYCKSGQSTIMGVIKPGDQPERPGLYLLDVVPDGDVRFGFPNIADNAEIVELIACGAHLTLFTTGRGSVVGSAISPVIKVCANPETYEKMPDDMDINAGRILLGETDIDQLGQEIFDRVVETAVGRRTAAEQLGHQEFVLTYKWFKSGKSNKSSGCHVERHKHEGQ